MKQESEIDDLLTRELRRVAVPADLWARVETALDRGPVTPPERARAMPAWMYAAAAVALLVIGALLWTHSSKRSDGVDLQSFLVPVQNASTSSSGSAIFLAPPHFRTASSSTGPTTVGGYPVMARREAEVGGNAVKQMVLRSTDEPIALFIAPSRVPLQTGGSYWVDSHVAGVACKRLNSPRTRTVLFPCLQQTCVLVCKACSETAMLALIRGVDQAPEILQ